MTSTLRSPICAPAMNCRNSEFNKANEKLGQVRRGVQNETLGHRGHKLDPSSVAAAG